MSPSLVQCIHDLVLVHGIQPIQRKIPTCQMLCRIIGGRESEEHAHPWIARVFGGRKINCNFFCALYAFELYSTITVYYTFKSLSGNRFFSGCAAGLCGATLITGEFFVFLKNFSDLKQRLFVSIYRWSSFSS